MKKRILIGFAFLLFIFLIGSLTAVLYMTKTTDRMDQLILLHQVEILREDLIIHIQQVQSNISRKKTRSGGDVDALIVHVQEMDKVMDSCVGCHHSPELTQGLLGMRDMANDYKTAISRLITASANPAGIDALERRAQDLGQELIGMTQGMAFTANVRLQQKTQETMATLREVKTILFVTLLLALVLALAVSTLLMKTVDGIQRKLLEAIRRISGGDLQYRLAVTKGHGSEFRELGEALNAMTRNFHHSQRQMVQSAKLIAIGELAANIAYQISDPLTGVLGYTGLLLKSDDMAEEKKEQIRAIERETLHAREIVKNLLSFARRKPPCLVKSDIRTLVQDTLDLVKGRAQAANIKITPEFSERLPLAAVDSDDMKQVFLSLVDNAFAAMPNGGLFTVRCYHDENVSGKEFVVTEFNDTGIGIPDAQLDKIFDPFFTTRLESEGTGLGLSISYMIVQSHGGHIEVESEMGAGSSFRVSLPVSDYSL